MKSNVYLFCILILGFVSCNPNAKEKANEADSAAVQQALYPYDVEKKISELGINIPEAGAPVANYVNAVRSGNLIFLAGKGPKLADGTYITGKVGSDLTIEEGYEAASLTAIQQLASIKAEIGNLNNVVRIVKVHGMVNAGPDFKDHPSVINGFSDLMVEVFGERGKHARAAVGMGSLPSNIAVEIEVVVEVRD
ncbi:RidA family protein [Marinigracilibium pacificum]|uniref:RidA family protein n=1 Tax=Marinigracilibium pacificum TaxID=2729599 RepID=A0A848IZK2_9BACT|nr:RidA family protein [Marinigracilibium pacificum]NMM48578.1 RidA family protein [Marinigracilibium pacificum]